MSILAKLPGPILFATAGSVALLSTLLCACSGAAPPTSARAPTRDHANGARPEALLVADAGTPIDEALARFELDRLFRGAGLRILSDVYLHEGPIEVTLDGFDPERRIGYEYLDPRELDTDLDAEERDLLEASTSLHILILDPEAEETLRARAQRFLEATVVDAVDAGP